MLGRDALRSLRPELAQLGQVEQHHVAQHRLHRVAREQPVEGGPRARLVELIQA